MSYVHDVGDAPLDPPDTSGLCDMEDVDDAGRGCANDYDYRCDGCGGLYCTSHLDPETHNCPALDAEEEEEIERLSGTAPAEETDKDFNARAPGVGMEDMV